jgi:thiamine kinase-like enzyme
MFGLLQKVNKYKQRLNGNWENVHKKLKDAWNLSAEFAKKPSDKYRNILCHGDLWLNNILFKLDEDGKPTDAALVDFQIIRYVPPAMDIVMFLHATTTRDFRERHILELLMTYQVALQDALKIAGLENHALSLQELLQSVHEYRFFGVVVAAR